MSSGHDRVGRFVVIMGRPRNSSRFACSSCGMQGQPVVRYLEKLKVDEKVECAPSFIGRGRRTFGVSCGCYARLHRQLVHIEEWSRRRG